MDETPERDCTHAFQLMGAASRPLADYKSSSRWQKVYHENLERMKDFKCKVRVTLDISTFVRSRCRAFATAFVQVGGLPFD